MSSPQPPSASAHQTVGPSADVGVGASLKSAAAEVGAQVPAAGVGVPTAVVPGAEVGVAVVPGAEVGVPSVGVPRAGVGVPRAMVPNAVVPAAVTPNAVVPNAVVPGAEVGVPSVGVPQNVGPAAVLAGAEVPVAVVPLAAVPASRLSAPEGGVGPVQPVLARGAGGGPPATPPRGHAGEDVPPPEGPAASATAVRTVESRREALARGHRAEALVAERLAGRGWLVLATNWRGGGGELDVVVAHDGKVRFVEVKVREPADPLADDAVSPHKRRRLRSAAEAWLAQQPGEPLEACFLVAYVDVAVEPWSVRWVDDAF